MKVLFLDAYSFPLGKEISPAYKALYFIVIFKKSREQKAF